MKHVGTKLEQSERRVCRVLAQPRSTQRYKPVARDEERPLLKRISELVRKHPRRGYRMIWGSRDRRNATSRWRVMNNGRC